MATLLVKFKTLEQVGPEDWSMVSKEHLFDENTKLSEVKHWIILNGGVINHSSGYKSIPEVNLSEPLSFF
jgi:hypothetical protein